jgi:hypothetical protein
MPTVQRRSIQQSAREFGANKVDEAVNALSARVSSMPRSIGSAVASLWTLRSDKIDGTFDRGELNVELGSQINMSSPLRANPQMWTDLMAVLEKYSKIMADSHRKQTELAIGQSVLSTDETMRTVDRAVEQTNKTMAESLAQLHAYIQVDEKLYSNILRRLRADLRIDRERFGRLRDGMR